MDWLNSRKDVDQLKTPLMVHTVSNHIKHWYLGPNLQNLELKLVEEISVQCNSDIDCPVQLICEKNACRKQSPLPIHIIKGIHTSYPKNLS